MCSRYLTSPNICSVMHKMSDLYFFLSVSFFVSLIFSPRLFPLCYCIFSSAFSIFFSSLSLRFTPLIFSSSSSGRCLKVSIIVRRALLPSRPSTWRRLRMRSRTSSRRSQFSVSATVRTSPSTTARIWRWDALRASTVTDSSDYGGKRKSFF